MTTDPLITESLDPSNLEDELLDFTADLLSLGGGRLQVPWLNHLETSDAYC